MVAALPVVDLASVVVLLAFVLWGAQRGTARGVLALLLLAAAFPLAARYGPRLETTVVKVVSLSNADARVAAWGTVFLGVLLGGGLLLALVQPSLDARRHDPRRGRLLGGLLGLVQGVVVVAVAFYGVLMAVPTVPPPTAVQALERSVAARGVRWVGRRLREVAPVPPWLEQRAAAVDGRIGGAQRPPPDGVQGGTTRLGPGG